MTFLGIHNMAEQTLAEVVALSATQSTSSRRPKRQEFAPVRAGHEVLIAGAGISGLTLALMLHRRGVESVIFEQTSEIREVSVGISILPHAIGARRA
jgi:heterodisulfide reductase subunit A-like polyferredoxin